MYVYTYVCMFTYTYIYTYTYAYTHTHTHTCAADAHLLSISLASAFQTGRKGLGRQTGRKGLGRQSASAQAKRRSCQSVKVLPVASLQRVRERVRGPRDAPSQEAVDKHRVRAAMYASPFRAPIKKIFSNVSALVYLLYTVTVQRAFENLLPV